MKSFPVFFVDRGKARDQERRASWIHCRDAERANTFTAKFQWIDQEANRLVDLLDLYKTDKRKRDFEILLLKGDPEKRKTHPREVPPGPSPEQLQEQRERDAEKARKDKQAEENSLLMVYMREVKANLAINRDYYRKQRAAAELEQQTRRKALGCNVLPAETNSKIKVAMDRAKAAGRPIEKLTFKMICDIMQDKLWPGEL
jgi:hypothetical protein